LYAEVSQRHTKGIDNVLKYKNVVGSNTRVCIYPKDVQRITGKTYRQARLYLKKVKDSLNKEPHQLISIEEFCAFSGLQMEHVLRCIIG
jgi:hypothetical protein